MPGIGTVVNATAIVVGTLFGTVLKNGIPERYEKMITKAVAVAVIFIGISGTLTGLLAIEDGKLVTQNIMLLTISLIIGSVIGEWIDLESKLEVLGDKVKSKLRNKAGESETFTEGFVSATILFCVGAMAIVGSLNDGMLHDPTVLFTKSILDGVTSIVYGATLGIGVAFSAIPLGIYQGLLTALSGIIAPVLTDELIANVACVGNAIIFCIGINLFFGKKVKVGNMFIAMFIPVIWAFFQSIG